MKTIRFYILFTFLNALFFTEAFSQHESILPSSIPSSEKESILIKQTQAPEYEGEYGEFAFISQEGDTIVPFGKYAYCYTDTLRSFAIVLTYEDDCIAIDKNDKKLFNVYWYDNGPDYIREGLFRITDDNGKLGYADKNGTIVITPQFAFGFPFENGVAKVTYTGTEKTVPACNAEYHYWESDDWFYINKQGNKVRKPANEK